MKKNALKNIVKEVLTENWGTSGGSYSPNSYPNISLALFDITSFIFILDDVPDPVWYISTINIVKKQKGETEVSPFIYVRFYLQIIY